jgi:hypothetical protein
MKNRHEAVCVDGPTGAALKEFMKQHAIGSVAITRREYDNLPQERKRLGLPYSSTIIDRFGAWQAFAEWCGLSYERYARVVRPNTFARLHKDIYTAEEIEMSLHTLKGCRQYQEPFVDLTTGETYMRQVTVLR